MGDARATAVRIEQELCSHCLVCFSVCPFEAIRRAEGNRLEVEAAKCQVCGICYAACPVSAIDIAFYEVDELLGNALAECRRSGRETLVLMCRGNSPGNGEVPRILSEHGIGGDYLMARIPCAGRIPMDFLFRALAAGLSRMVCIQCEEGFCRMREGSSIGGRRARLGEKVLDQLGYPEDSLRVIRYSRKARWDGKECVGCDKCVFVCPYEAITAGPFSSPIIDGAKCMGCGACQMVCPHHAIQVDGYEFDRVLGYYSDALRSMKVHNDRPAILIFSCQWSEYSALDDPAQPLRGMNSLVMEVPCVKGLDAFHVANALDSGFDGVMAVVCPESDCKLQRGRDVSARQLEVLKDLLRKRGLMPRFEIEEVSPRDGGAFKARLEAFSKRLAKMSARDRPIGRCGP